MESIYTGCGVGEEGEGEGVAGVDSEFGVDEEEKGSALAMHIEVKNLNKEFGSFHAVQDVSFEIEKGKLIGFLGPSGGGKTSILRMLAGLETPTSGDIYFHGKRVEGLLSSSVSSQSAM